MKLEDALEFIHSFINYERTVSWSYPEAFKLDRMRNLAKQLGNPQKSYETILIAGSKGKGSVAAILSSILRMDNLKVGLYTSPHLVDLKERVQVNGLQISEANFIEIAELLRRTLDSYEWRKDPPTYFELLTALALYYFKQMKVHVAVLEVGLGGLYDSTNIAESKVVGIAPISLEHTDKLGKTVSKIAVQKCGIIKGREIVVSASQPAEAETVIQHAAEERDCELLKVGKDLRITEREWSEREQSFDLRAPFGNYFDLKLSLLGRHQIENAALAIGLAKSLEKKTRLKISDEAVRRGVLDARWPGRLEKISDRPVVLLDGAHNAESARRLTEALERHFHFNRLRIILGASSDKDIEGILRALPGDAFSLTATRSANPRSMEPRLIAEKAEEIFRRVQIEADPWKALGDAKEASAPDDLILVTGSLFLLGDIKSEFEKQGAL
jgi:dihydrofolate synthase/folylpolyglutamate synthase